MKIQLTKLLLLLSVIAFTMEARAAERWETLRAINWVENPTNHTRAGRFGELGPYQFRSMTWRMHTTKPFQMATQRAAADEVAVKHYDWIKHSLEQAGVEGNAFNIAMAWNCGVQAVISGRIPTASFQYAQRVTNLIESFSASQSEVATQEMPRSPKPSPNPVVEGDVNGAIRFRILLDTPRFDIAS